MDLVAMFILGMFVGYKLLPRLMRYVQSGDRPWG